MLEVAGEKIILKEFTDENLYDSRYFSWLRDIDVVLELYRLEYLKPMHFSEVETYIKKLFMSENDCFFALYHRASLKFIGTVKIGHINWRVGIADLGLMIGDKEFWGQGIGSEAVKTAVNYAFQTLSLRKVSGGTASTNIAMCRCFEKVGFKQEAIKRKELLMRGEYVDHLHYGLLKEEFYASKQLK